MTRSPTAWTYIGSSPTGDVEPRVIQVSPDGQTVAFRSSSKLDPAATEFATNVYVWRKGTLRFVATEDRRHDGHSFLRYLSENGRYLVVYRQLAGAWRQASGSTTSARAVRCLSSAVPGPCEEVYVFDADEPDAAKRLSCASCRTDGLAPVSEAGDPGIDRPSRKHRFGVAISRGWCPTTAR